MTVPTLPAAPNSGATGFVLARGRVDAFRSMGTFGKPAYQSYVQLRAMLKAKCGDEVANYFARPSYDPETGELTWTSEVPGVPRRWSDMDQDERDTTSLSFEVIRSRLVSFSSDLRAQGGQRPGGATAFAELIDQAMQIPAQGGDFVQFVDGQPIISFWGFQDQSGQSVLPVLPMDHGSGTRLGGVAGAGGKTVATATTDEGTLGVGGPASRRWWWWLLALLALIMLLLALLRFCVPRLGINIDPGQIGGPLPGLGASAPEPGASDPLASGEIGGPGGIQPRANGIGPDYGPGGPGGSVDGSGTLPSGTGPAGALPPGASGPGLNGVDPQTPAASLPDGAGPRNPTPDYKKADPSNPDPNKPDPNKSDPNKPDPKDPKAPKDPKDQKPPAKDPKAITLPDKAGPGQKMDYLAGDWKAGEGLYDQKTRQPLDMGLKFDNNGKGEITLRRHDGSQCSGPVQGSMGGGGKLSITGGTVPCSNGESYAPPKIECNKDSGGQTQCFGYNKDGSPYELGIRRQ